MTKKIASTSELDSREWINSSENLELLSETKTTTDQRDVKENENANNNKAAESEDVSEFKEFRLRSFKKMSNDPVAKMKYLLKPGLFVLLGTVFICAGVALTVSHFLYEDSLAPDFNNPPYFTYGPVCFATGVIVFMIGVVWFSIKYNKWVSGSASPIASAVAAAATLAASATLTSEQLKIVGRESVNGLPQNRAEVV